jgi:hypothetical protein
MNMHNPVTLGTIGGTFIAILINLGPDLIHTGVLAIFGAVVSFLVSIGLKWTVNKYNTWKTKKDA